MCPVHSRSDPGLKHMRWLESAYKLPLGWIHPSNKGHWLCEATIYMFAWAYSQLYYEPDQIIKRHEIQESPVLDRIFLTTRDRFCSTFARPLSVAECLSQLVQG